MRWTMAALFAGLLLVSAAACADDKKPAQDKPAAEPGTRAERLAAAQKDFDAAQKEFRAAVQAYQQDSGNQDKLKAAREKQAGMFKFADRFQKLVDEDPKDAVACDALVWLATKAPPPKQAPALKLLAEHHLASPKVAEVVEALAFNPNPEAEDFLKAVAEKATTPASKGYARFGLAMLLSAKVDEAKDDEAKKLEAELVALLETVVKDGGTVKTPGGTLAEMAKPMLFELQRLKIGMKAPEVECATLDGKKAKLSDYLGKVVVIDIWATWCGPCRAMIPHERELVERLKGKPFTFISISGDDDVETLKKFLEKEPMPWVHWHAGGSRSAGPRTGILTDWNIRYFPTIYVIDAKGVIRHKGVRGPAMDKAVDELLKELGESKGG
jgi:thiol-disulfide isomerase/thioredoxin